MQGEGRVFDMTPINFVEALLEELGPMARDDVALLPFVAHMVKAGREGFDEAPLPDRPRQPDHVDTALQGIAARTPFAEAVEWIARNAEWRRVLTEHADVPPKLSSGMHAAHVLGPAGVLRTEVMRGGLFLLAPGIHYPLHTHVSPELYYVLSGTVWIQHGVDGKPEPHGAGTYSITPTGRTHSLTTGDEPVLIAFLWIGDANNPIYWWEQDAGGAWHRAPWIRNPDASWKRGETSPVTADLLAAQTLNPDAPA